MLRQVELERALIGERLVTGEELAEMGDIGRGELVEGQIIRYPYNSWAHGVCVAELGFRLGKFVERQNLGQVLMGGVGIFTRRDPDTVRAADLLLISYERMAGVSSSSYLEVAPELAIEVIGADDRWSEVQHKLHEYFNIGVKLVWLVDPSDQTISLYHSLTDIRVLDLEDALDGEEVLPGFTLPLVKLFGNED